MTVKEEEWPKEAVHATLGSTQNTHTMVHGAYSHYEPPKH